MQCLRCPNEAIPGKALCASCFAAHQKKVEFEETDDWVQQQLEATRNQSRGREREAKGPETSPQSLILSLAPALLGLGGLLMLSVWIMKNVSFNFTPTPDSEQAQGVPVGVVAKKQEQPNSPANRAPAPQNPNSAPIAAAAPPQSNNQLWDEPAATQPDLPPTPIKTATPTSTPTTTPTTTPEPLA